MTVTAALIVIPGLCYALAACMYLAQKNWALAIVYSGYSWANVGLLVIDLKMQAK